MKKWLTYLAVVCVLTLLGRNGLLLPASDSADQRVGDETFSILRPTRIPPRDLTIRDSWLTERLYPFYPDPRFRGSGIIDLADRPGSRALVVLVNTDNNISSTQEYILAIQDQNGITEYPLSEPVSRIAIQTISYLGSLKSSLCFGYRARTAFNADLGKLVDTSDSEANLICTQDGEAKVFRARTYDWHKKRLELISILGEAKLAENICASGEGSTAVLLELMERRCE